MFAKCLTCGRVFPYSIVSVGGGGIVSMKGNRTNCRYCGGVAEIMDGDYHYEKGQLTSIENLSRENAEILLRLLRGALRNPPENADQRKKLAQKIAEVSPSSATFLDQKASFAVSVMALIVAILTYLSQLQSNADGAGHDDKMLALAERLTEIAESDSDKFEALTNEIQGIGEAAAVLPPQLKQLLEEIQTSLRSESGGVNEQTEEPISKRKKRRLRGKSKSLQPRRGPPG